MSTGERQLAVTLHAVEPETHGRCALIRDWLADHGVDRVTLLVIPAPDSHPFSDRRPELAAWVGDCARGGDAVAQQGFRQAPSGCGAPSEFSGLGEAEACRAVDAGRRVLHLAGVEPLGFVAPAYSYPAPLRLAVAARFAWYADVLRLHVAGRARLVPAVDLDATGPLLRFAAVLAPRTLRLDLHPADLDRTGRMLTVERILARCRDRRAVTLDELAGCA